MAKKEIVRIFLLFDGDVERSIKSLDSILNQTYPFKKIYIVLLTTSKIAELILKMKDQISRVEFIDRSKFQNLVMQPAGDYVQFVLPGDKLRPEMIMDMVEIANPRLYSSIMMSELSYPENLNLGSMPRELDFKFDPGLIIKEINGLNELLLPTLKNNLTIISSLSRIVCRQKIFDNAVWISPTLKLIDVDKVCIESISMLFVVNIIKKENVCRLNEKLVERGARNWTAANLQFHEDICKQILEKL